MCVCPRVTKLGSRLQFFLKKMNSRTGMVVALLMGRPHREPGFQFDSPAQVCPILCNPMDCSTPGFSVHHQLPELTQIHVH